MDRIARTDWKRHSAPYDLSFVPYSNSVDAVVDQAMEAFISDTGQQRTATMGRDRMMNGRERKKSICTVNSEKTELSTDTLTPGVLKVFGETILPGVQYKSVLASCRSTAQELVKEALERFGLPTSDFQNYVLCDVVGTYGQNQDDFDVESIDSAKSDKWERIFARKLADRDKPLLMQKFWRPIDGYSRRYELHERAHVIDTVNDDDTSGLNQNARKILISKLRPGAIPLYDASNMENDADGLNLEINTMLSPIRPRVLYAKRECQHEPLKKCSTESDAGIPMKHPFFVNLRGFDVTKDRSTYVIKSKRFTFGKPSNNKNKTVDSVARISLFAPDIESVHCNVKVYKLKKKEDSDEPDTFDNKYNYFLELEPVGENVVLNGCKISEKVFVRSGDILCIGLYYMLLFKDCTKGNDVPLALPWLHMTGIPQCNGYSEMNGTEDLNLRLPLEDESNSNTDESVDASIAERISFAYIKDKEDELVKYICAIIQQQNTCRTYSLTVAYLFSMCIEHASRKFDKRQLKHLFLRILFTIRESVAETAKSLSACQFSCNLLDASVPPSDKDKNLERLLLWISNCVQLLLFLKHTFQLPEITAPEKDSCRGRSEKGIRKDDNAKHALGQLITGLEEIVMFCFQQCVYTITKTLHPVLPALLDSNPFSGPNTEQISMMDVVRMLEQLAEVTHIVMLHEGITRQLFTYLFFFTNTSVFNKLVIDESGIRYYNWQCGVRVRANLSQLEDWATQNGLEDEFSQMFERLLAVSELLATSKNTLIKYQWPMMKTHFQPLTPKQLHHILTHYDLGGKQSPVMWSPSREETDDLSSEGLSLLPLSTHPPFALPDNCGFVDLIRAPEDSSFWNHLRRLKSLYGTSEDDSDSGFSISNTPRGSSAESKPDIADPFYEHEDKETPHEGTRAAAKVGQSVYETLVKKQKTKVSMKKCNMSQWTCKVPKPDTGVCNCGNRTGCCVDTDQTLADDLMKVEHRNHDTVSDATKDFKELYSKPNKVKLNMAKENQNTTHVNQSCKTTTKEKQPGRLYEKRKGDVADISTSTLPKSVQIRQKNKLKQIQNKIHQFHSFSVEDLPLRLLKHKPSASFEEAIERGYTSDTFQDMKGSSTDAEEDNQPKSLITSKKNSSFRNGVKRHKSLVSESITSDEVFFDEARVDNSYNDYLSGLMKLHNKQTNACRHNVSTTKPMPNGLKILPQKLASVSFETSTRRPSIELTKDTLFVNNVNVEANENAEENGTDDRHEPEVCEAFPIELFTEVSESKLAAMKRHGSSLNVAPSSANNSPRNFSYEQVCEVLGPDDQKRTSPCPMFTVYLHKADNGFGLSLIDGLHTTLCLSGIYIRKILPDSPAASNGCLQPGDRILAVDGKSVIGASYNSAMNAIRDAGSSLTLLVARGNDSIANKVSISQV
ncbi:hypothetical protein ACF0H5_000808 [Mactra antiquata]